MKTKKPTISIFTTIWGHKSIGVAIRQDLGNKYRTYFNFIKPDTISVKSYSIPYLLFPHLNKIPFEISQSEYVGKIVTKYLFKSYIKKLEQVIQDQKPDIVISAYFAFTIILERLSKKYGFALINIVADPKTFHRMTVSSNAYNFVFNSQSEKRCSQFGVPKNKIVSSGWFVRKEFQKSLHKESVRKTLGLEKKRFTLSIVGGSEGAMNILKILPAFVGLSQKIQVIFICGKNKGLYQSLKLFQKIQSVQNGSNTSFVIKGFTENTHKYIQASDIVIGKAGPNLLFETVATHTPFFAISHIAGQEDGNLDIIKQYKIGFVEENPVKAIKLVRKIIKNPSMLDWFQKPLQKLANYNRSSSTILVEFIKKQLRKNNPEKFMIR